MKRIINQYAEPIVLHLNAGLLSGVMQKSMCNLIKTIDVQDSEVSPEILRLATKGYVRIEDVAIQQPAAPVPPPSEPTAQIEVYSSRESESKPKKGNKRRYASLDEPINDDSVVDEDTDNNLTD